MMVAFLSKSTQNGNNIQRGHNEGWEEWGQRCIVLRLACSCSFMHFNAHLQFRLRWAAFSHKHIYANVHKYSIISMSLWAVYLPPSLPPPSLCHSFSQLDVTARVPWLVFAVSCSFTTFNFTLAIGESRSLCNRLCHIILISSSYHRHLRHSGFTFKLFRIFCASNELVMCVPASSA